MSLRGARLVARGVRRGSGARSAVFLRILGRDGGGLGRARHRPSGTRSISRSRISDHLAPRRILSSTPHLSVHRDDHLGGRHRAFVATFGKWFSPGASHCAPLGSGRMTSAVSSAFSVGDAPERGRRLRRPDTLPWIVDGTPLRCCGLPDFSGRSRSLLSFRRPSSDPGSSRIRAAIPDRSRPPAPRSRIRRCRPVVYRTL